MGLGEPLYCGLCGPFSVSNIKYGNWDFGIQAGLNGTRVQKVSLWRFFKFLVKMFVLVIIFLAGFLAGYYFLAGPDLVDFENFARV